MDWIAEKELKVLDSKARNLALTEGLSDVFVQALPGTYLFPLLLVVMGFTSGIYSEHPVVMGAATTLILAASFARAFLLTVRKVSAGYIPAHSRVLMILSVLVLSATLNALLSFEIASYGFGHWLVFLSFFWLTGTAGGAVISFAPELLMVYCFFLPVLIPAGTCFLIGDIKGYCFCIGCAYVRHRLDPPGYEAS